MIPGEIVNICCSIYLFTLLEHISLLPEQKLLHCFLFSGLVEMLNRVQNTRADDQRGLLCKEDLVLPEFLKLPTDEKCDHCQTTCQALDTVMETVPLGPDISTEICNEKNISSGSTLPAQEAMCCTSSDIEDTNASTLISIDSHATAATVVADNVMEKTCTNEDTEL